MSQRFTLQSLNVELVRVHFTDDGLIVILHPRVHRLCFKIKNKKINSFSSPLACMLKKIEIIA